MRLIRDPAKMENVRHEFAYLLKSGGAPKVGSVQVVAPRGPTVRFRAIAGRSISIKYRLVGPMCTCGYGSLVEFPYTYVVMIKR